MLQMGFSSPLEESLHLVKLWQKFQFAHVQERYLELAAAFVNNSVSQGLYSLNRTTRRISPSRNCRLLWHKETACTDTVGIEQTLNTHHIG